MCVVKQLCNHEITFPFIGIMLLTTFIMQCMIIMDAHKLILFVVGYILKDVDQRSKLVKSQGSCKMMNSCTSEIKLAKENNKISVEWQKVHYGHNKEIKHIRLPKAEDCNNTVEWCDI